MAVVINGSGTVTGISVGGLPDDIVDSGTLADDAVGLAQMASGTDGNVITYDTSGNPAAVSTGSSGQVLTSAGAGAAPTMAAAAEITEIDKWVLTVDKSDSSLISANLERVGSTFGLVNLKGTGMTQSSGVFTFPSTGYWMVTANCLLQANNGDNLGVFIDVTDDNSTWETQLCPAWQANKSSASSNCTTSASVSDFIKVENVSLDKVRFTLTSVQSGSLLQGSTSYQNTTFDFIRLGGL